ncbi:MAG: hypothetical protein EP319_04580 [Deltaproteobacteria bacterium]|nr:MAG: hypothetical protein EP319_04580 [Deltaproteobacteria bacterium]
MRFWLIPLTFVLLVGCGSETKRKITDPRDTGNKWEKTENSAVFVNQFITRFWNKSYNELFSNGEKQVILTPHSKYKLYRGEPKHYCKSESYMLDGDPVPLLHVRKGLYGKAIGGVWFGFSHNCNDYFSTPQLMWRHTRYTKIHDGAIFVNDADTLKKMLVDAGVPLFFCHEGASDRHRIGYYNSHISDSDGMKSFRCVLSAQLSEGKGSINYNTMDSTILEFMVDFGVFSRFRISGLDLTDSEKNLSFREVFRRRFTEKKYLQDLEKMIAFLEQRDFVNAQKNFAESKSLNRETRAYQRNLEKGTWSRILKNAANSMEQSRQEQQMYDRKRQKVYSDILDYKNRWSGGGSSRKSKKRISGSVEPVETKSGGMPVISSEKKEGTTIEAEDCESPGIGAKGAENMNAGPYSPSGKKWCGYSHYMGTLERAKAKKAPKCSPVPKDHCPSEGWGRDHCRTSAKTDPRSGCGRGV